MKIHSYLLIHIVFTEEEMLRKIMRETQFIFTQEKILLID